jgi:hypothetical protein
MHFGKNSQTSSHFPFFKPDPSASSTGPHSKADSPPDGHPDNGTPPSLLFPARDYPTTSSMTPGNRRAVDGVWNGVDTMIERQLGPGDIHDMQELLRATGGTNGLGGFNLTNHRGR